MAKKQGKTAAAAAPAAENTQAQAPAQEAAKEKTPNVFVNRISEKLIRPVQNAKDGKDWVSVGFGMPGPNGESVTPEGKPVIGSVLVRGGQVLDSTKKGPDGERVPNDGFKNIMLGQPNQHYQVSYNIHDAEGKYVTQRMSAEDIKTAVEESNKAYRAQKKAEKQAAGKEGIDAPEAPAAENEGLQA